MDTFGQGLWVSAVGMVLVFLSLLIVAGLLWALSKVFPGTRAIAAEEALPGPEPVLALEAGPTADSLADQAAAIAVAILLQGASAGRSVAAAMSSGRRQYPAMPWERPAEMWGDAQLQGETVVVLNVDPGSGNWKSRGRLALMQ